MKNLIRLAALPMFLASLANVALADLVVFSSYEAGAGSVGDGPLTSSNAFDAAIAGHAAGSFGFETAVLPAGIASITNPLGASFPAAGCGGPAALFGYATDGSFFYCMSEGGSVTFNFAQPIFAFGAYFTGVQVTHTLTFNDGSAQLLNFPSPNINSGGTTFMGFTDFAGPAGPCASTRSVTYNALTDIVGVDSLRWATSCTVVTGGPVPEPATLALLALGLAGLVVGSRNRA